MEKEWYSACCYAPPLFEVIEVKEINYTMGLCMKCRCNTTFKIEEKEQWN